MDAMTLYWHGVAAKENPLMQFLSFYQTIEYYYNTYSEAVARRSARSVLKIANFNPDRDEDLAKVVNAVKSNISKGFGGERLALRATLGECITESDAREFIKQNPKTEEFISKSKILKIQNINLSPNNNEIVMEIANRIYEIRCRIVHAKPADEEKFPDPILPYTIEEQNLNHDIEIVRFCAQKVLAMSASSLVIPR